MRGGSAGAEGVNLSLTLEVGNARPSRFHLKVAETPAADTLLETKAQQRMKWSWKHWESILFIYLACLYTDQMNAHMQGMYAHPPKYAA